VKSRIATAKELTIRLADLPAVLTPYVHPHTVHTYWKYCLRLENNSIPGGCDALGQQLKARHISCTPHYIQKPAFQCRIFREQKTFGNSRFPFTLARPEALQYDESRFPQTYQALRNVLVLPWNENYEEKHVDFISDAIHDAVLELAQ
jgi:dTDP-4-amino-4,6-dideoxygalactose transaminase